MRHHALIVAAASLAVSSFAMSSFAADVNANPDNPAGTGNAARMEHAATTRPADNLSDEQRANIRNTLGDITQAALSPNGVKDAVAYFAKEDADRIGTIKQTDELNDAVTQFNKDWRDKYGQPFELKHDSKVFEDAAFRITPGMEMRARQAGEHMGPTDQKQDQSEPRAQTHDGAADMNGNADNAKADAARNQDDIAARSSDNPAIHAADDENAKDRNMKETGNHARMAAEHMNRAADAQVTIAASHGLPETTVDLVKDRHWLVNVSDSLTADNLQTNLLHEVQAINQDKANWPADINDGYRMAAHHVFKALQSRAME